MNIWNHIDRIGDIFAIPFFVLLIFYFYELENKNSLEYVLFYFSIFGFMADIYFTYRFVVNSLQRKITHIF